MQPEKLVWNSKQGGKHMKRTIVDASQLGELEDKVVSIKRVTKVVKGGRNFRFTALVVVGDKNGHVGAGLGKAAEIPEAIRKGKEDAMKKLISLPIDENGSVPHDYIGKFGSATVLLKRSPEGTGVIAGGPARNVLELAGFKNIRTKSLGSNNKQNVVLATIDGLSQLKTPEEVAKLRGISVEEMLGQEGLKMAGKLKITLVKSTIGAIPKHKKTVEALGLKKPNKSVEMPDNAAIRGMIDQVRHLVKVEEI